MKALLRAGNPIGSFTSGGEPGYLCRFASVTKLLQDDPEVNNLVLLGAERRKLLRRQAKLAIPKPAIIKASASQATAIDGGARRSVDIVFSAVQEAVSPNLPRHIWDDVIGQLFLDVEEGRVALSRREEVCQEICERDLQPG